LTLKQREDHIVLVNESYDDDEPMQLNTTI